MAPVFLKTSPPRQQSLDEDRRKGHGDRQLPKIKYFIKSHPIPTLVGKDSIN